MQFCTDAKTSDPRIATGSNTITATPTRSSGSGGRRTSRLLVRVPGGAGPCASIDSRLVRCKSTGNLAGDHVIRISDVKAHLELVLGLPADVYSLRYGTKQLEDDVDTSSLRLLNPTDSPCIVLTVQPRSEFWLRLLQALYQCDSTEALRLCRDHCGKRTVSRDGLEEQAAVVENGGESGELVLEKVLFAAMCVASCNVDHKSVLTALCTQAAATSERFLSLATPGGRTPLHVASACDNAFAVQLLLTSGFSHLATDSNNMTPLNVAYRFDSRRAVAVLQRHLAATAAASVENRKRDVSVVTSGSDRVTSSDRGNQVACLPSGLSSARSGFADGMCSSTWRNWRCKKWMENDWNKCAAVGRKVETLIDPGIAVRNVRSSCNPSSAGLFQVSRKESVNKKIGVDPMRRLYRSAYYKALCTKQDEMAPPLNRPAQASIRYRPWKTWLTEQYDAMPGGSASGDSAAPPNTSTSTTSTTSTANNNNNNNNGDERRHLNDLAFKTWKRNVSSRDRTTSGDESNDELTDYWSMRRAANRKQKCDAAFADWLSKKSQQRVDEANSSGGYKVDRSATGTGIFVICCTDASDPAPGSASECSAPACSWSRGKPGRNSVASAPTATAERFKATREHLNRLRLELLLDGMTYSDWMSLKRLDERTQRQRETVNTADRQHSVTHNSDNTRTKCPPITRRSQAVRS